MTLQLSTIQSRLSRTRASIEFQFDAMLSHEQDVLRTHYGIEGDTAASVLDDSKSIAGLVDELGLVCLAHLGEHWRRKPKSTPTGPLAKKIRASVRPWWEVAFGITLDRKPDPIWPSESDYPPSTPDTLVNRFIWESSVRLADLYHRKLIEQIDGKTRRSEEHDTLIHEMVSGSPSFAHSDSGKRYEEHRAMADAYRKVEGVRHDFKDEPVVLLGERAFEAELTGKSVAGSMVGMSGKHHSREAVQSYISKIANLPAFGEWEKAKDPAKAIAMARAIQSGGIQGIAFTANLTFKAFGSAVAANRETGSALQERLRRVLTSEFSVCPNFYFVVERGLGQWPHVHGAVALDPSRENRKRLRNALVKLALAENRRASERWVDAKPFTTPARWAAYAYKHPLTSKQKTGVQSVLRATRGLRGLAHMEWEVMRQEQRDARTVMSRVKATTL